MPKILKSLAVVFLATAAVGADEKPASKVKEETNAAVDRMVANILERMDTNKDGKISRQEAKGRIAENFDRLDTNKDGYLDKDELRRVARIMVENWAKAEPSKTGDSKKPEAGEAAVERILQNLLERMDANKDGNISREEAKGKIAENFDRIDANKDGFLDKDELRRVARMMAGNRAGNNAEQGGKNGSPKFRPNAIDFDALDKNADGRLTREEVKGTPLADHFDEIDADKDGTINRKELRIYLEKQAAKPDSIEKPVKK